MENLDYIRKIITLTGGTLGEILNMSSDDIEPAESGETFIDTKLSPHQSLFLFITTDHFDSS